MNPNLICATLASLTPVGPSSPAPWASGAGPAEGDAQAFSRALNEARQANQSESARPPAAPSGGEGEARPAAERSERGASGRARESAERAPEGPTATARPAVEPQAARRGQGQGPGQGPSRREGSATAGNGDAAQGSVKARARLGAADEEALCSERGVRSVGEVDASAAETLAGADGVTPSASGERAEAAAHLAAPCPPRGRLAEDQSAAAGDPRLAAAARLPARGGAIDGAAAQESAGAAARGRTASGATGRSDAALGAAAAELRATFAAAAAAAAATSPAIVETGRGHAADLTAGAVTGSLPPAGALPMLTALTATGTPVADAHGGQLHEGSVAAALGSEGFAREVGAQVSILVREGVQQARLHLNPQELGPVLVRIQLEGQAAQVHLAAELQPTRQALEQALPALASQLSEAGITLTGGGVFERPANDFGRPQADTGAGGKAAGTAESSQSATGVAATIAGRDATAWSRPRGIVDLIA